MSNPYLMCDHHKTERSSMRAWVKRAAYALIKIVVMLIVGSLALGFLQVPEDIEFWRVLTGAFLIYVFIALGWGLVTRTTAKGTA